MSKNTFIPALPSAKELFQVTTDKVFTYNVENPKHIDKRSILYAVCHEQFLK